MTNIRITVTDEPTDNFLLFAGKMKGGAYTEPRVVTEIDVAEIMDADHDMSAAIEKCRAAGHVGFWVLRVSTLEDLGKWLVSGVHQQAKALTAAKKREGGARSKGGTEVMKKPS